MIPLTRSLRQRRQALVSRSSAQRARIADELEALAPRLRTADRVVIALRSHPWLTGIAAAGLVALGSRTLLRWATRLMPFYMLLRRL